MKAVAAAVARFGNMNAAMVMACGDGKPVLDWWAREMARFISGPQRAGLAFEVGTENIFAWIVVMRPI